VACTLITVVNTNVGNRELMNHRNSWGNPKPLLLLFRLKVGGLQAAWVLGVCALKWHIRYWKALSLRSQYSETRWRHSSVIHVVCMWCFTTATVWLVIHTVVTRFAPTYKPLFQSFSSKPTSSPSTVQTDRNWRFISIKEHNRKLWGIMGGGTF